MTDEVNASRGCVPETRIGGFGPSLTSQKDFNAADKMNSNLTKYKNKMKDGKRAIVRLKRKQDDGQLDTIISDLLLLESSLRNEQSQILSQLSTRDATIALQRQEIDRLRRDNRRLISRLKKITEGRSDTREGKNCGDSNHNNEGSGSVEGERKSPTKKSTKGLAKRLQDSQHHQSGFASNRPFVKQSVMTPLASQFYEKSTLQFTDENGKVIDRVMHKPPIAEKPKLSVARVSARPVTAIVRTINGQCNIVSTISRLLDEESDQGINGSSGSSEPSSPEATLKPTTPRVIRLAREYEKGLVVSSSSASDSGRDSGRSGDEQSVKALVMDEYEVTSGYNSDAVSDQDHDYENIVLFQGAENDSNRNEDDDNYVILRAVKDEHENTILVESEEDQHIYSNIEFARDGLVASLSGEEKESLLRQLLETDIDGSDCASENELPESPKRASNIPRSRQNINLVIGSEESHLMDNFEEFLLDSLDLEEDLNKDEQKEHAPALNLRLSGDGAEAKNPAAREHKDCKIFLTGQGGYEKFLEVTGLSQKSILTPTRMFSNHRSMLKPRDIKHRDKLRAAFTTLSTLDEGVSSSATSTQQGGSSQRYWREPYL